MYYNVVTPSTYGPMIINRHDTVVGYNISMLGAWMESELKLLREVVSWSHAQGRKLYFVDGGANVGMHSLAVGGLRVPGMRHYAIEAQRSTYYQLCGSLALNSLSEVIALHRVLGARSGELVTVPRFDPLQQANFGGFSLAAQLPSASAFDGRLKSEAEQVASIALDDLLGTALAHDAVIIKLDIEGMEPHALRGASAVIRRCLPVLYVEYAQCTSADVISAFASAFDGQPPYRVVDMPEKNLLMLPQWCDAIVVTGDKTAS